VSSGAFFIEAMSSVGKQSGSTTHPDDDETGEEFGDGNALDQTVYWELD
jgi:hypothetical protein